MSAKVDAMLAKLPALEADARDKAAKEAAAGQKLRADQGRLKNIHGSSFSSDKEDAQHKPIRQAYMDANQAAGRAWGLVDKLKREIKIQIAADKVTNAKDAATLKEIIRTGLAKIEGMKRVLTRRGNPQLQMDMAKVGQQVAAAKKKLSQLAS